MPVKVIREKQNQVDVDQWLSLEKDSTLFIAVAEEQKRKWKQRLWAKTRYRKWWETGYMWSTICHLLFLQSHASDKIIQQLTDSLKCTLISIEVEFEQKMSIFICSRGGERGVWCVTCWQIGFTYFYFLLCCRVLSAVLCAGSRTSVRHDFSFVEIRADFARLFSIFCTYWWI